MFRQIMSLCKLNRYIFSIEFDAIALWIRVKFDLINDIDASNKCKRLRRKCSDMCLYAYKKNYINDKTLKEYLYKIYEV